VQQVNLIAYQPQQERAYRRLVPRAVRSIEHPNNANLKVKALGVGERERTSHDIHVGAGGGCPTLRREFVDVLRLGRPTFVARGLLRRGVIGVDAEAAGYLPKVRASIPIFISASRSGRRSPTQGCE
jgi:hypothetical protein